MQLISADSLHAYKANPYTSLQFVWCPQLELKHGRGQKKAMCSEEQQQKAISIQHNRCFYHQNRDKKRSQNSYSLSQAAVILVFLIIPRGWSWGDLRKEAGQHSVQLHRWFRKTEGLYAVERGRILKRGTTKTQPRVIRWLSLKEHTLFLTEVSHHLKMKAVWKIHINWECTAQVTCL